MNRFLYILTLAATLAACTPKPAQQPAAG
ncbi:MAG: lipoprotein, partial [Bacteroidales bacterium]|nr:lipoprotein [Bacteroidales bacterium]